MSLAIFRQRMHEASYGENDKKKRFPKWLARYADVKTLNAGVLPVTAALAVEFSKSLLKSGTPAWQRLQGVRAVEAYRDLVLGSSEPCLKEMKTILGRFAATERESGGPGVQDEQQIIGIIDPSEPALIQQMRKELRRKALETERAYIGWILRFIRHCGSEDLQSFGEGDKGRISVLSGCCLQDLSEQVEKVRRQHTRDLVSAFGRVYLPHALERI